MCPAVTDAVVALIEFPPWLVFQVCAPSPSSPGFIPNGLNSQPSSTPGATVPRFGERLKCPWPKIAGAGIWKPFALRQHQLRYDLQSRSSQGQNHMLGFFPFPFLLPSIILPVFPGTASLIRCLLMNCHLGKHLWRTHTRIPAPC